MSNIDLLPRADLPVIWSAFKAQAEPVRQIAETLTVTDISQKEEMALARKTRLTLREIRIAVEHKRVELGEGHLTEIQKINGAAKAIREFIEPLEARLLVQESFAERVEADRIAALTKSRNAELESVRLGSSASNTGNLSQADYDIYITRLRAEKAELETANRLRVEAEKRLADAQAEALLDAEAALVEKAADNARRAEAYAEAQRNQQAIREEAEKLMLAQQAESERQREEYRRQTFEAQTKAAAEAAERKRVQDELNAVQRAAQVALDRIRDEQFAKLEAELAQERAAKQAEADAARKLALAPDVEKLRAFWVTMRSIPNPELKTDEAIACLMQARFSFTEALSIIETFCIR